MSTTNVYFSQGTRNEQYLIEDLIIESLKIYGQEVFYIPRTLVSKDEILGEDRLSRFTSSYPIEMYFENVDSLDGQGAFIQKFGMMLEQSATLVVSRRRWDQLVGQYDKTIIPIRPCEGDLIYFPLTKSMFEIKFVKHQDPFYQLGKLYVYKLQVELFQYASERIDTGVKEIDAFETLKTFTTNVTRTPYGEVTSVTVTDSGSGYDSPPTVTFISNSGTGAAATAYLGTGSNSGKVIKVVVTNNGTRYQTAPSVQFSGGNPTVAATATATIENNIDKVESFGDNNKFKIQAADDIFNAANPFGEIDITYLPTATVVTYTSTADSNNITADSNNVTADTE